MSLINKIKNMFSCKHKNLMPMSATVKHVNGVKEVHTTWMCLDCNKEFDGKQN